MNKNFSFLVWAVTVTSLLCVIGAVAVAVILFFFGAPILLIGGVSLMTYIGGALLTYKKKLTSAPVADLELPDAGVDIAAVKQKLAELNGKALDMPDELKAEALKIADTAAAILEDIEKNPQQASDGRRYVTHYLDSAVMIISTYVDLKAKKLDKSTELEKSLKDVLMRVSGSFQRQRQYLLQDDVMKLKTEMEVLGKTLELESGA